ncbi:hypothetical protein PMIN01_01155 [Paraphaeosphaeria minitans]|uniref:Uncharacterized protein n=1 Tax=Paraphaeosphaeria minitans TaxID=565426 RepID=A0A9P6GUF4_9PLEO|nr:hypothetical protein PMIN01_01155 [Paraphaeosphaeria minitans]
MQNQKAVWVEGPGRERNAAVSHTRPHTSLHVEAEYFTPPQKQDSVYVAHWERPARRRHEEVLEISKEETVEQPQSHFSNDSTKEDDRKPSKSCCFMSVRAPRNFSRPQRAPRNFSHSQRVQQHPRKPSRTHLRAQTQHEAPPQQDNGSRVLGVIAYGPHQTVKLPDPSHLRRAEPGKRRGPPLAPRPRAQEMYSLFPQERVSKRDGQFRADMMALRAKQTVNLRAKLPQPPPVEPKYLDSKKLQKSMAEKEVAGCCIVM